ncbi:MAG: hypothetical protein OEQ18_10700, partial [Gammaproteobacteria bacterium]|nr:hypothetical protein [Gammaproteobacteria bacterium]
AEDIHVDYQSHRNNVPYADALRRCQHLRELFHEFRAEKTSFRLLRCRAGTAYSLHDDRDAGGDTVRIQLPVITNAAALLLVQKDGVVLEPVARRVADIAGGNGSIPFDYQRLRDTFAEWFDAFYLGPGRFHLIDTNQVHTLINAGDTDRITLCIDLIRNTWVDCWLAENMTIKTPPLSLEKLPEGKWDWSALRHGVLCHPRIKLS